MSSKVNPTRFFIETTSSVTILPRITTFLRRSFCQHLLYLLFSLGFDDDSPRSNVVESVLQDPNDNDSGLIEGSETEEDIEFSYSDEEDIRTNGGATSKDSVDLSSFDLHLQHNSSKEEIDNQKNLKFSWDVPVIGVSNCKWIGDGENILEVYSAIGIPVISCLCCFIMKVQI